MDEQRAQVERLNALVARLRQEYADDANVRAIGWGLKRREGALQDVMSIIFYVRRKLPSERAISLVGSRPIPEEIEGLPTDVEESNPGVVSAGQRDEQQYDPLVGGVASSNAEGHTYWFNGSGTLGMLVHDAFDNAPMAISNWHVWADGGESGDDIIQPGHPTAADHIEALGKVAACGPLLTALIEWKAPSPLAAALYGGAAAAAVAAAASDYRDPIRRGQDQTPTDPDERTEIETVDMAIEYPMLPLPGIPFETQVRWEYERHTDSRVLTHVVEEERVNTQFLLGKVVVTDRSTYRPGERVRLTAAIWDYQPRPCDGYHIVAHLIPHNRPDTALRVVLHPTACPRTIPPFPPDDTTEELCVVFDEFEQGEYPPTGVFNWLSYSSLAGSPVRIVDWLNGTQGLVLPYMLRLSHAPATQVTARVAQFTNTPVMLSALNADGQAVGQATAPNQQGVIHELTISGEGIVGAVLRGGGGEGLLVSYCIVGSTTPTVTAIIGETTAAGIDRELPALSITNRRVNARRCCFTGVATLPPTEQPGRWDVHLTVQNINTVPQGTPPEEAATVIGGHLLSMHGAPDVASCLVVMLLDHAFDVI